MARPDKYKLMVALTNAADSSTSTKKILSFIADFSDKQYSCTIVTADDE